VLPGVIQGFDSQAVPGDEQRALQAIPDGKREHSVQSLQTPGAPGAIRLNQGLGIRMSPPSARGIELWTQLQVVVDFAVEDNDAAPVARAHRLSTAVGQINNRQASMPQPDRFVVPDAAGVRPPAPQALERAGKGQGVRMRPLAAEYT